jgi:hypothetical protein
MNDREILALNIERYERLLSESYLDKASLQIIRQLLAEAQITLAQLAEAYARR